MRRRSLQLALILYKKKGFVGAMDSKQDNTVNGINMHLFRTSSDALHVAEKHVSGFMLGCVP